MDRVSKITKVPLVSTFVFFVFLRLKFSPFALIHVFRGQTLLFLSESASFCRNGVGKWDRM